MHGWSEFPWLQSSPGLPGFEVWPGGAGGFSASATDVKTPADRTTASVRNLKTCFIAPFP